MKFYLMMTIFVIMRTPVIPAVLIFAFTPLAWWACILLLPFRVASFFVWIPILRKKEVIKFSSYDDEYREIDRYTLPSWGAWFATPDEHLPIDPREPTSLKIYDRLGAFFASWYNLGFRNVMHGIPWKFGKRAEGYYNSMTQAQKNASGVWQKEKAFKYFVVRWGWWVYPDNYNLTGHKFWAVPHVTVRRVKK